MVVSARSRIAGLSRDHLDQLRQIAAEQRLAAGEADLVDARARKTSTSAAHLLELQQVLPRQPDVLRFRHAVAAAEIAAVGDRQPQVVERPAQQVRAGTDPACRMASPQRTPHHAERDRCALLA